MDRDRLSQVHTTDLTESKINEDFLDFLKGPFWTYMLFILIGVAAWLGLIRWRQYQADYALQAWTALNDCTLPGCYRSVATDYGDITGLPQTALRAAADTLLQSVQLQRPVDASPLNTTLVAEAEVFTPEQRDENLRRADAFYAEVVASDSGEPSLTLHIVSALAGRAVVAECEGRVDDARTHFEAAADRAGSRYTQLAARYRRRAAAVSAAEDVDLSLPAQADLPTQTTVGTGLENVQLNDALRELLLTSS